MEVREVVNANSYCDVGERLYGKAGKAAVNLTVCISQMGFVTAYLYFIMENVQTVIEELSGGTKVNIWWLGLGCFLVFTSLSFVRKIQKFAKTHIFAIIMIVLTVIIIIIYGAINLKAEGSHMHTVPFIEPKTWTDAIGFSIYSFEGIGLIIPVSDVTATSKKEY